MKKSIPILFILSFILIIGAAGFLASCTGKSAKRAETSNPAKQLQSVNSLIQCLEGLDFYWYNGVYEYGQV